MFVNFSSVNSCNSPWTMKLSSELCWSSPRGLPLAAPAYTAAIRTLGRRLCWHEALWREAPLPSFSFLFSFLLFHTISGCFCTLHSTMQDVHFGSFLICTFCIPCILPYIDWRSWLKSKKSCSQHKRTRALETNIYKYRDSHRVINSPNSQSWSSMEFTLSIGVARKPLDISWSHLPWQLGSSWHGSQKALRRWKNSWRVWSTSPAAWSHPRSKKVPGRWCTTCWHLSETWKLPDKAHSSPLITTHHHSSPLITTHHLSILLLS